MGESEEGAVVTEERDAPGATPEVAKPKKERGERNWTLIALIIVSALAAMLLASTITLAATGNYGHCRKGAKFEEFDFQRRGPGQMRFREDFQERGWQQQRGPMQPNNQDFNQAQPPPAQSVPVPQAPMAPTPGQGP